MERDKCAIHPVSRHLILGLLLLAPVQLRAQTATLNGMISAVAGGRPLANVNVVLVQRDELVRGAVSDPVGLYVIARISPGLYSLRASSVGYETFTDTLELASGDDVTRNITLRQDATTLDAIVVRSKRGGAAGVTAGLQTIRPEELELVPSPDVTGDLAGYLTTLPSVVTTGDRGGQFFVRGGEPSQT